MKRRLIRAAALLVLLVVGGFLVAASGLLPIKASTDHWPVTAWFLHFTMRRHVVLRTLGVQPPRLDDPRLVLRGAGHYETGCQPCHGSPGRPLPRLSRKMVPAPPYLPDAVKEWEPEELFYIVKHGVKFTGMPAWPAQQRDDEVWAMVAFLLRLPDLDGQAYRRLASPEPSASTGVAQSCARCHGADGLGRGGASPRLAGQRPLYLYNALQAFARGRRHSGIMEPVATDLSNEERRQLAFYYSGLSVPPPLRQTESPAIARGREIAIRGVPGQRVPSCTDCHGPNAIRRNPAYPVLAGQYADYLVLQLELFKNQNRGGSPYARLMRPVAGRLTPEQMRDVALYYQSLVAPPGTSPDRKGNTGPQAQLRRPPTAHSRPRGWRGRGAYASGASAPSLPCR